ncbi:hypothetical protein AB4876_05370 [Zhongshania guokunii]|uniref:Phage integrase family protein n=1 Tax=Zhongshania guokunii TaxID=641783 RepID=A0ABV3U336_9GAMM
MSYENARHRGRLLNIDVAADLFGSYSTEKKMGAVKQVLAGSDTPIYLTPEFIGCDDNRNVYNMPFLLNDDGTPWWEANAYLCYLVENKHVMSRPTDDARRKAARLLDYKLFTEDEGFDWLDFSGRRLSSRPTYRYFYYLCEIRALSAASVNQYTSDVYSFYEYTSRSWHPESIQMERVDSVKTIRVYYQSYKYSSSREVLKRSQTKRTPGTSKIPTGYVREDGEVLRPLNVEQISELKKIVNGSSWEPIERLIVLFSLLTGARKQTVLTIRLRHIRMLSDMEPQSDGSYKLQVGPGTLINTKNSKKHNIYIPSQLRTELIIYGHCEQSRKRREKFKLKYRMEYPGLPEFEEDDLYLFMSDQGNCYYMATDDPRHPIVKSRPSGQVVDNLKRKIFRGATDNFPRDFYYHWLRATYAFLLWLGLQKSIDSGTLSESEALSFIQNRLSHKSRETTENYLKLFKNIDVQFMAQELFEDILFSGSMMDNDQR